MNQTLKTLRVLILVLFLLLAVLAEAQSLRSVMVNACSGGGSEGENEYVVLYNSGGDFVVSSGDFQLRYSNSFPATTTYSDSFLSSGNAGYVNALNAYLNGTCDFNFLNATNADTIRAGSYFVVMYEAPTDTPDFSYWCGSSTGDIPVLFSIDPSWNVNGNFVNAPSNYRNLRVILPGDTQDFRYTNGWSSNADGNYVTWNDTGAASAYANYSSCAPDDNLALPIELLHFGYIWQPLGAQIFWSTATEINNSGFRIEFSTDGTLWTEAGFVPGAGNSEVLHEYTFQMPLMQTQFYVRFIQLDFNGDQNYSPLLFVRENGNNNTPTIRVFPEQGYFSIGGFDEAIDFVAISCFTGEDIVIDISRFPNTDYLPLPFLKPGIYVLSAVSRYKRVNQKFIISQ
ncbi:MAG: hypothetical protein GC181_07950 [Bacteroidetes bacterium]|nr:hypothetical protein [Bacteroidota bacterium]